MDKKTNLQKAIEAYEAFNNLKEKKERNTIDNKLLNMLDPKVISYFKEEVVDQNIPNEKKFLENYQSFGKKQKINNIKQTKECSFISDLSVAVCKERNIIQHIPNFNW